METEGGVAGPIEEEGPVAELNEPVAMLADEKESATSTMIKVGVS